MMTIPKAEKHIKTYTWLLNWVVKPFSVLTFLSACVMHYLAGFQISLMMLGCTLLFIVSWVANESYVMSLKAFVEYETSRLKKKELINTVVGKDV
jgi:hypothetical protein